MDNWSALFDGQTRYFLDINDSSVKPGCSALLRQGSTERTLQLGHRVHHAAGEHPPEEVLMKYASFRMRSGKSVHGMVTRLEWLSTSKDQSHYPAYAQFAPGAAGIHPTVRRVSEPVRS